MAFFLPQRWRRQPTYAARINWANPLARGIIAAYPMWRGSTHNAVGGPSATVSGTMARGAAPQGEFADLDGSSYLNRGSTLLSSGTSAFTISWYSVAHAIPSYPSVFCTRPTGTSNPFFVIRASDASGGGNYRLSAGPTAGVTDIPAWRADAGNLPALAVGMEERMVLVCAGGTDSRTLADYRLARNGVYMGTAPQVTAYGSLTTSDEFIGWDGGDGKWDGVLGDFIIWGRALTNAEAVEYSQNPYQIWEPISQRLYFDIVAGGGGTTYNDSVAFSVSGGFATSAQQAMAVEAAFTVSGGFASSTIANMAVDITLPVTSGFSALSSATHNLLADLGSITSGYAASADVTTAGEVRVSYAVTGGLATSATQVHNVVAAFGATFGYSVAPTGKYSVSTAYSLTPGFASSATGGTASIWTPVTAASSTWTPVSSTSTTWSS